MWIACFMFISMASSAVSAFLPSATRRAGKFSAGTANVDDPLQYHQLTIIFSYLSPAIEDVTDV
jgi:hypothetical protein